MRYLQAGKQMTWSGIKIVPFIVTLFLICDFLHRAGWNVSFKKVSLKIIDECFSWNVDEYFLKAYIF
jgi:hypothetical protein